MFSALAEGHGNMQDKINMFIAMAPIVYLGHTKDDFLKKVSEASEFIYDSFNTLRLYEIFGHEWHKYSGVVC